jgi:single-strand DNA-binding protein
MNKVILMGRTGSDPEVKEVGENKVCKFSLATSESYKKNGEKVTDTTWHNLIFWGKQCDILKQYVHKGDQLLIEGKIVIRKYDDKSGVTHWATEIVCDKFEFIGSKKESAPVAKDEWQGSAAKEAIVNKSKEQAGAMSDINELPGANDNLPF